jgi:hypothetical protein
MARAYGLHGLKNGSKDNCTYAIRGPEGLFTALPIAGSASYTTNPQERYSNTTVILLAGNDFQDGHYSNRKTCISPLLLY